jgi:hypothetical protein
MKKHILGIIALFFVGSIFVACNKEDVATVPESLSALTQEFVTVQDLDEDIETETDLALDARNGGGDHLGDCPEVTVVPDDGSFPKTITFDYGEEGCEGPHGRIRKGQIVVEISDNLHNAGATKVVTFVNFSVDDIQIEGTRTFVNNGTDEVGNVSFSKTGSMNFTFPDGATSERTYSYTRTQIEGASTDLRFDDVFEITGSSNGVNKNGVAYSSEILEALIKRNNCRWIVKGIVALTFDGNTRTINYGDGTCNRFAEVTLPDGTTHIIRLHNRWW